MNDKEIIENKNCQDPQKAKNTDKIYSPFQKNGYWLVKNCNVSNSSYYEDN